MNPTDLVKAFRQELWGGADPTAIDRYVAPDARIVMSGSEGSTIEVMRADVARYFGAFENVSTEIVELVAAGDQVVLWWRTKGTHTGPYGDIAPEPTTAYRPHTTRNTARLPWAASLGGPFGRADATVGPPPPPCRG